MDDGYEREYWTYTENWGYKFCCFDLKPRTYNLPLIKNWLRNLHSVTKGKPEYLTLLDFLW